MREWERSAFSENTIEYVLAGETHTPVDGSTVSDGKFSIQPSAEWIFDVSDPKKVRVGVWVGGVLLSYTPHNIHLASQLLVLSYLCLWIDENIGGVITPTENANIIDRVMEEIAAQIKGA